MSAGTPVAWTAAGTPLLRPTRLVGLASILVDVAVRLPALPERGGDVVADDAGRAAGGGLNALAAAARLRLPAAYAGPHGTGPNGDSVRAALAADRVVPLLVPAPGADTGWCLAMVEPDGERTFVTVPGAEARQRGDRLATLRLHDRDALYVSGYDLAYPDAGPAVAAFVAGLPPAGPAGGPLVVLDPGPLVADVPAALLAAVLARLDLVTLSRAEAEVLGLDDDLHAPGLPAGAAVVLRAGAHGARVRLPGGPVVTVPGVPAPGPVVDTNGAGDVHTGALVAGLSRGLALPAAAALANAAAAVSVTRPGANSGPTDADLADGADLRVPGA
ncbi:PfkB family carbohydrate kinase [Kineosporia sp. R_H_3]|uniref:PfkB family carbohydrate kinase n=1 Tax=Kineosporia sp. R_H_3 TaxID=1961848 RepID=UPI000B4AF258|nr:PfkB family carbohydrate kinase [Kineosporia sp. R_H_3]